MSTPTISLSTSYLQSRFNSDGYGMLCEAAEMGFEYVELGHSTPITALDGIEKALGEGVVKVSSLHNFCPVPPFTHGAAPNLYSPATSSKTESQQWLRHTKNTMNMAAKVGARAVVCHTGAVKAFFCQPHSALLKFRNALEDDFELDKLAEDQKYLRIKDKFLLKMKRHTKKGYKNIIANFASLYAELGENFKEILCGVENREDPQDLPADWEFAEFAEMASEVPSVKLWHDVGHSKKKQQLQLCTQQALLESTAEHLIGWHLHDCDKFGKDHIAIGKGDIDFKIVSKYFKPSTQIFTLELNHAVKRADAIDSLKRVQDMLQI